jgi:hypothetical protein
MTWDASNRLWNSSANSNRTKFREECGMAYKIFTRKSDCFIFGWNMALNITTGCGALQTKDTLAQHLFRKCCHY